MFPHHENELAQSQAVAAAPCEKDIMLGGIDFVRYWMHNSFVTIDNHKMSKSANNFFTVKEILEHHHPLALRWFLLGTQYRQPLSYSLVSLEAAGQNVYYIYQTLSDARSLFETSDHKNSPGQIPQEGVMKEVMEALTDDINTPVAEVALYGALKSLNDLLSKGKKQLDRLEDIASRLAQAKSCLELLGFDTSNPEAVLYSMKEYTLVRAGMTEEDVQSVVDLRNQARKEKDYGKADEYRSGLLNRGILMCDTPTGTVWRPFSP